MATEVKLPELGENITGGDLVNVLVHVGDTIAKDQPIVELETEKAAIEVPSPVSGKVTDIKVKKGDKLEVGQVILSLEEDGAGAAKAPAQQEAEAKKEAGAKEEAKQAETPEKPAQTKPSPEKPRSTEPQPETKEEEQHTADRMDVEPRPAIPWPQQKAPTPAPATARQETPEPSTSGKSPADVPASPSVRMLAREIGLDVTEVKGSGPGGRVTTADVKAFAKQRASRPLVAQGAAYVEPLPDFSRWGPIEREPMSALRRKTAQHMTYAGTIPSVTQNDTADITSLEELRHEYAERAEKAGGKLTMTAIALKVAAAALKMFPKFNASLDLEHEQVVYKHYVHIGVAVDTDRGLLVPVIRDVDKKNVVQLAVELSKAAERARTKKLKPEDMEGGTFTITNLGGIGGTFFTPIINAPEVAILGMARAKMEPVWIEGAFQPLLILPLSLTYDHRIIDGAEAARFLRWVADAFEQPFLLALEG